MSLRQRFFILIVHLRCNRYKPTPSSGIELKSTRIDLTELDRRAESLSSSDWNTGWEVPTAEIHRRKLLESWLEGMGINMRSRLAVIVVGLAMSTCSSMAWAQRGYDPADQRPDLLPHPIYNAWVPYRAEYNRPRFVGGYLAYKFEPTSQEAMSWKENYCNGMYGTHCPTPIARYYYPKPWEALDVGPRKNTKKVPAVDATEPIQVQNT